MGEVLPLVINQREVRKRKFSLANFYLMIYYLGVLHAFNF